MKPMGKYRQQFYFFVFNELRVCQGFAIGRGYGKSPDLGTDFRIFPSRGLAWRVQRQLNSSMPVWKHHYPRVEAMKVAVIGRVVNAPLPRKLDAPDYSNFVRMMQAISYCTP